MGSSQSRVAKMEAGDPQVSIDLLLRGLFALGVTSAELAAVIQTTRASSGSTSTWVLLTAYQKSNDKSKFRPLLKRPPTDFTEA